MGLSDLRYHFLDLCGIVDFAGGVDVLYQKLDGLGVVPIMHQLCEHWNKQFCAAIDVVRWIMPPAKTV